MEAKHFRLLLVSLLMPINFFAIITCTPVIPFDIPVEPNFPSINIRDICYGIFFAARPLPGSDQFFIGCIKGEGVILQCEMGMRFNPDILKCIYFEETTTTTSIPTTTPDYNLLCRGRFDEFIEHPNDCGRLIYCHNQIPVPRECPPNEIFDINLKICRSGNRKTCEFYEETTTAPPDHDNICDGLDRVFLEHPDNCQKAIFCINGIPIVSICPENKIFDINTESCRPGNPNTCEFDNPTSTEAPNYDLLCEGRTNEFIRHPTDCTQLIFCFNERAVVRQCGNGTIFDLSIENCRPGDPNTCEFYIEDIQPLQAYDDLKGLCKGHHFNYIEHPHECDKAIFCLHEHPILEKCPMNKIFDVKTESCREGNRETCEFSIRNTAR